MDVDQRICLKFNSSIEEIGAWKENRISRTKIKSFVSRFLAQCSLPSVGLMLVGFFFFFTFENYFPKHIGTKIFQYLPLIIIYIIYSLFLVVIFMRERVLQNMENILTIMHYKDNLFYIKNYKQLGINILGS